MLLYVTSNHFHYDIYNNTDLLLPLDLLSLTCWEFAYLYIQQIS